MLSILISTVVFFIAGWFINRYLDGQEIPKGMSRGVMVFVLALLVSWGAGELVDWTQVETDVPQTTAQTSGELNQLLKAVGQIQR